jgi:hypothetical protein
VVGNAFTFQCSVAEVNAVNCRARGKGDIAEPQLELRRQLARQMMKNTLDGVPEVQEEVVEDRRRRRSARIIQHTLKKRAGYEGRWCDFKMVTTDYVHLKCTECKKMCRTYCSCAPQRSLCTGCFALHESLV